MRKRGWLTGVVNIAGRLYITDEGIAEFQRRAEAGEFAKDVSPPDEYKNRAEVENAETLTH
jgi:hypothetical protein